MRDRRAVLFYLTGQLRTHPAFGISVSVLSSQDRDSRSCRFQFGDLQRADFRNQLCLFPDLSSGLMLFAGPPSILQS